MQHLLTAKGEVPYVGNGDILYFHPLIMRGEGGKRQLRINATTTWNGDGKWSIDETATERATGTFVTERVRSKNGAGLRSDYNCQLSVTIVSQTADTLSIKGQWIEGGDAYDFAGDLQIQARASTGAVK